MTTEANQVVPLRVPVEPPPGYWQREASHYPQPLYPVTRAILPVINGVFREVFTESGAFLDTLEFREIGGWAYTRQVPFGGKDRKAPPPLVMKVLLHTLPSMRARLKTNIAAVRNDTTWREVDRWLNEWKADQVEQLARLRAVDTGALDDRELAAHLGAVHAYFDTSIVRHFRLVGPALVIADLVFACKEILGWEETKTFTLLAGLSTASTEPAHRLGALAAMAAERPAVRRLLERPDRTTAERLAEVDPAFAAAFAAYQRDYGYRALRYEVAAPTLIEVPEVTLGLIRDQLRRGFNPEAEAEASERKRATAVAEARAAISSRPAVDRERFERALERAQTYYPIREDNEFYTISAPIAVMRFVILEVGRRMTGRGQLRSAEDVFFLELAEIKERFVSGAGCRALVEQRQGERAGVLANPGPASYGKNPGPPPDLSAFPPEAARTLKSILWSIDRVFESDRSQQSQTAAATLHGIAAAPGRYTGPVRVILSEDEFDRIEAGDVLVCPITSPVWSVLFPSVGALVTDTGGVLSHPAIISREYGIPAVVATGNATSLLKDGQVVTVDGGTGTVSLADVREPVPPPTA